MIDDFPLHHSPQVLLPADILARSPSSADGISNETETEHRIWACGLIQEAGILLRLPMVCMCTAQNLLHRFYYRKSLKRFEAFSVAMGCFFLACKIEEKPKRLRETLFVFDYIWRCRVKSAARATFELGGARYNAWKAELVKIERHILKELGFSFYLIDHAHKFILFYIQILGLASENDVVQKAWNYLNDSLRRDFCLRYRSEVIACAAIFMAARFVGRKLPTQGDATWWEVFRVRKDELDAVVEGILDLYARPKVSWLEPLTPGPHLTDDNYETKVRSSSSTALAAGSPSKPSPKHREKGGVATST